MLRNLGILLGGPSICRDPNPGKETHHSIQTGCHPKCLQGNRLVCGGALAIQRHESTVAHLSGRLQHPNPVLFRVANSGFPWPFLVGVWQKNSAKNHLKLRLDDVLRTTRKIQTLQPPQDIIHCWGLYYNEHR